MAEVLGYSLMKHNINARRIMMVTKETNTVGIIDRLEFAGWTTKLVHVIPQPGKPSPTMRFRQMFTKLHIWELTECDVAVFLDVDTLVLKNFNELFTILPNELQFAATPDIFYDNYVFNINAGVFVCKPNVELFQTLLDNSIKNQDKYDQNMVEQGFFNYYFKLSTLRLPFIYNANLAIWKFNNLDWKAFEDQIKIIHYTLEKPSLQESVMEPFSHWNRTEAEFLAYKNKRTGSL